MSRAWALLALAACEPSPLVGQQALLPPSPSVASVEGLVARTLGDVERVRGVMHKGDVRRAVVSRAELRGRVSAHVRRDVPEEAVRSEEETQKLLGLFPVASDYETAVYAALFGLAAYYEPADRTIYVANDLSGDEPRATLSHELAHALADERWDLGVRLAFVRGDDDRNEAVSALSEGEATVVAETLAGRRVAPKKAATALEREMQASYTYGAEFVRTLVGRGGWKEVDDAWGVPLSTAQILHPDTWRSRGSVAPVAVPPPPSAAMALRESNVRGELGVLLFFEEWMEPPTARESVAGWNGDRLALYTAGDERALMWHVKFEDASPRPPDTFSARAMSALSRVAADIGSVTVVAEDRFCVTRALNGPLAVARQGRDLYLAAGTVAIARGGAWRARMTCDDAFAWITSASASPVGRGTLSQSAGIDGRVGSPKGSLPSAAYSTSGAPTSDR